MHLVSSQQRVFTHSVAGRKCTGRRWVGNEAGDVALGHTMRCSELTLSSHRHRIAWSKRLTWTELCFRAHQFGSNQGRLEEERLDV